MDKQNLVCFVLWIIGLQYGRGCEKGWLQHGDSCYCLVSDYIYFLSAMNYCKSKGAHVVEINSESEEVFVRSMCRDGQHQACWLGGTDRAHEGVWLWASSLQRFTYQNWLTGEPNNSGEQDCLQLLARGWDDVHCTWQGPFICEAEVVDKTEPVGSLTTVKTGTTLTSQINSTGLQTTSVTESGSGISSPQYTNINTSPVYNQTSQNNQSGPQQNEVTVSNTPTEAITIATDPGGPTSVSDKTLETDTPVTIIDQPTESPSTTGFKVTDISSTSFPVTTRLIGEATQKTPSNGTSPLPCEWPAILISDCCSKLETVEEIQQLIRELRRRLLINKTDTSKFKRTMTSAVDHRPSASGLGYSGGIMLAAVCVIVISLDAIKLVRYLQQGTKKDSCVDDLPFG